jgi:uncharacterized protein YfbU (UPF0304 family)
MKRKFDRTVTERANAHVERLLLSGGKRLVVDLDAESATRLQSLMDAGYAMTQKDVVVKAIAEVSTRLQKNEHEA